jgi:hypothetical protein
LTLTHKIAAAAGALTLAAGGVAAAASPPEAADHGLTTAEAQVGVELPASKDAHPGAAVEDESAETEVEAESEAVEVEADGEGLGPVDNHGAVVSVVAQDDATTGREHGEAVSAVARDNAGAEASAAAQQAAGERGRP